MHHIPLPLPCWPVARRDNGGRGFTMRLGSSALALTLASSLLAGCQSPDVGQRCELLWNASGANPAPTPASVASDYFETGNAGCDNLVCIVSPQAPGDRYYSCAGAQCGYCSKPCVSDKDCFKSETGLVCRQIVLDPAFIEALRQRDPATAATYLANIQFSSYCAVP
jgi:hypothetical protein